MVHEGPVFLGLLGQNNILYVLINNSRIAGFAKMLMPDNLLQDGQSILYKVLIILG